ncbi:alkaline phosphatase family protein [Sphingobacterium kitahiroshimense]|uniref:Alkaline phosphatase family protein n=1 Tax=Sphingobacterium kitahiroshimense TaxID=470446 RepID=A0ABV0BWC7_9SPHI
MMKRLRHIFIIIFALYQLPLQASVAKLSNSTSKTKKVLLIGIDGIQYEMMRALKTPSFDHFNIVKAYAGGIVGTPSEQTTGSGPGWITTLTGVWSDQNGVISNDTANKAKAKAKSVFQYLKAHNPALQTTSIATWAAIHDFLDDQMAYVDKRIDGGTDADATIHVLRELENHAPDLLFVHFSDPDVIGHNLGYGPKYDQSIQLMDSYLGTIMQAVHKRTRDKNEEWLVILTTDHGRRGDGHNHGSQTTAEKTIFIGMNILGNSEFHTVVSGVPNKDYDGLYTYQPQTAILPTILTYLDIKINNDWQLASPSLIGKEGPRRVMINTHNSTLYWHCSSPGEAKIYTDRQLIATVPANKGYYPINTQLDSLSHCYTLMINGQSGSVMQYNRRISAAMALSGHKRLFFLFNDSS